MSDWPELCVERDHETLAILHLASQMLGKIRVANAPWMNHGWHVALQPNARGLATLPTAASGGRTFTLTLDLCRHAIVLWVSDESREEVPLNAGSVAALHRRLIAILEKHGLPSDFNDRPNEIPDASPFAEDTEAREYDRDSASRFREALAAMLPVFGRFRAGFEGKASPVQFWWGSFDLAVGRFSGRKAPPHPGGVPGLPDRITREAYSREVSSAGFWAGGVTAAEPFFYSYIYPEPAGYRDASVAHGRFDTTYGEFVLPYAEVRAADDSARTLSEFFQSAYDAAADLGNYILDKTHGLAVETAKRTAMTFDLTNPVFHDEAKAREYLESLHWPDGPVCPRCESMRATKVGGSTARPGLYMCNNCRRQFTVTVGTIFEDSKIPLNKWLLAYRLLNGGKKGHSANELSRMLGLTYKSAWFMAHRIRESMKDDGSPLGGPGKIVESDEAFVGGSAKKRLGGKVAPMKKVMTLVERDGRARSFHVANINHNNIRGAIVTNVDRASTLMTDDARVYWPIGREFAGGHGTTLHANREFARPGGVHSNTAENFFSILKRGVVGTYHHWSPAHMHRYLAEFDFRYSTRSLTDAERTAEALKGARGKRLMYRQPCGLAA